MKSSNPENDFNSAQMSYFQDNSNVVSFFLQGDLSADKGAKQLRISYEGLLTDPELTVSQIMATAQAEFNTVGNPYSQDDVISGMKALPGSFTVGDHKLLRNNKNVQFDRSEEWRQALFPEKFSLSLPIATLGTVKFY